MNKPMHDQSDAINNLCDAILSLKDREECLRFFDDLCTRKELQSIAQRFEVAKLLAGESSGASGAGSMATGPASSDPVSCEAGTTSTQDSLDRKSVV